VRRHILIKRTAAGAAANAVIDLIDEMKLHPAGVDLDPVDGVDLDPVDGVEESQEPLEGEA
jgi:hypothetical protein